ncbi:MAG: FGGY family carbohydrate kinase, partial [Candidatus Omnitrophica bacterium]|nr:FGGY family carbohydrate kinase [Candidatus Omnitrophota bacterium]
MESFLSFDCGTTNTKVFLYSVNGRLFQDISIRTGISFPGPLMAEQNCHDWISAIRKGIKRIRRKSTIAGIAGSFQGGTFVLLDKNL